MEKPINSSRQSDAVDQSSDLKCWKKDEGAQCLRVECSSGKQFLFPYGYFEQASFAVSDDEETIELVFTTRSQKVSINGRGLEELWLALQNLSVGWVRPLPARFAPLLKGRVCIHSVSVELAQEAEPVSDN